MTVNRKTNDFDVLQARRKLVIESYDSVAGQRDRWIKKNRYYYDYIKKILKVLVEPGCDVLQVKCETGYYLNAVKPRYGLGLDYSQEMTRLAKKNYPGYDFQTQDLEKMNVTRRFDYVLLVNALGDIIDVQKMLTHLRCACDHKTRLVIINYNALWQPLINLARLLRLKIKQPIQNWLSPHDIENLLYLSGYEVIKDFTIVLCPVYIPLVSAFLNRFVARLPVFRKLCLDYVFVARRSDPETTRTPYPVSVIIPCKNERENIERIVTDMPQMGKHTEIIFCDDRSTDGTADEVLRMIKKYPERDIRLVHGPGICKSKNVWAGFEAAKGEILMIFDADVTVSAKELPYFYEALTEGKGDFINGSRLVYSMQENAMTLSKMAGNKFFSLLFSYILDQKIKDTLCGTKVFWRSDYLKLKKYIGHWGAVDLWGDYDLLFGASKLNLKIIDLPVHYFDRTYGSTKMSNAIANGLRMLKISFVALAKIKFF